MRSNDNEHIDYREAYAETDIYLDANETEREMSDECDSSFHDPNFVQK